MFPGHHPGPRKWLRVIEGVIDTAQKYLEEADGATTPPDAASELVKDAERLGSNAYLLLQHMAGSDAEHIPHQIVAPFQRWVDAVDINNTVFFRADHVANYELAPVDLRKFIRRINSPSRLLRDAAADIDWPVLRVTVPSQALGMLPHFAVVAHELGHAIQDQIPIDLSGYVTADLASIDRTKTRLSALGLPYGASEQIERQAIVSRWLNELKSDAVGYLLAGPAFFFALAGFLELAGQGWGISRSHPPSILRREVILEQLSQGSPSFIDVFHTQTGVMITAETNSPHLQPLPGDKDLFDNLATIMGHASAAICVELIPLMRALAQDVVTAAAARLTSVSPASVYTAERLNEDLSAHLEDLVDLVPPIERRLPNDSMKAASLAGILNVGWAALLTRLDAIPAPPDATGDIAARKMERLHALLLKAVELSEARQLWDAYK